MNYPDLLSQSIYSPFFNGKFLLMGSCVANSYPEIIKDFEKKWKNLVSICLEQEHYNKMVSKLFNVLGTGNVKKIGFLTVNGSPHCAQVHFASKYLKRGLNKDVIYRHYVINDDGKVYEVSMEAIDKSRDFVTIGKALTN